MVPIPTLNRVTKLRELMRNQGIHAYVIPSEDAHQSEYIADCDGRRSFISGFTGSAGHAVVTLDKAALWTDGRYFLQASKQLESHWTLMKFGLPETPTREQWLCSELPASGGKVGIDSTLISVKAAETLQKELGTAGHSLVALPNNLVDQVWGADRPPRPSNSVFVLENEFCGKHFTEKLKELRSELSNINASSKPNEKIPAHGLILTALDDIAWLFNLRGSDISYNPVFFAYALISQAHVVLWVDDSKIAVPVQSYLSLGNVSIRPYSSIFQDLKQHGASAQGAGEKYIVDGRCNWALVQALGENFTHVVPRNPVTMAKSIKNATEIAGFRACHIRDARALITYFAWLEDQLVRQNAVLDEVDGADVLEQERSRNEHFIGLSFDTISSTGPNGAVIHYKPEKPTALPIDKRAIYLCDSGAQYKDGTTDVTRTLHFGTPTTFEKLAYTRVLQGHIALARAVFPVGTSGYMLDILARTALWTSGLDFRHGTGHGVGHFLNVHEGPHSISPRPGSMEVPLAAGMTVTDEPGYYHDGDQNQATFGIRIENILVVREVQTPYRFGNVQYLGFENVTFVPMEPNLIDTSLLSLDERNWINDYHAQCWNKVSPTLDPNSLAFHWLRKKTLPI